jgi:hypothetical protein
MGLRKPKLQQRREATGTFPNSQANSTTANTSLTVSGLSFTPSKVILYYTDSIGTFTVNAGQYIDGVWKYSNGSGGLTPEEPPANNGFRLKFKYLGSNVNVFNIKWLAIE